jgi:asparagine synthase (glutamine-hydrolysing)
MCAINGFNFPDRNLIFKMKQFTSNRGPDAEGLYIDGNVTIFHNRLSIIDPEEKANQPMSYKNFIISFNGEIYNYKKLRSDLIKLGYKFKTKSDTEVILHLFDKYKTEAFKKISGIFAICIWDKIQKKLYLVRDTVGVKPLYYLKDNLTNKFFFSSSIRALILNLREKKINKSALNYYSNLGRNDSNETAIKNIFKLMPGELLILENNVIKKKKYLKFNFTKKNYSNNEIKELVSKTIQNQLVSDVPISLSLSGGVDSNVVYSIMRNNLDIKFNTYSFKFRDYEKFNAYFNIAKKNTEYYGNNFIPVEISYKDFIDSSEKVTEILEEPIANQCSILNYCMSKEISEKVLITGDGGDEIFTGYDRYRSIYIIQLLQKFNIFKKLDFKSGFKNFDRLFLNNPKELYLSFSEQNIYKNIEKYFTNFEKITANNLALNHLSEVELKNNLNSVALIDLDTLVPNEYLLRNDKIFMDSGIEVRVPFYDVELLNNLMMMSTFKKFGYRFKSKDLLKKIFKDDIHSLVDKKWGLQSPLAKWMKGPLQNYIKEILSLTYYNSSNILNFDNIEKLIKIHKEKYFNPELLWSLVMIQIYLRKYQL